MKTIPELLKEVNVMLTSRNSELMIDLRQLQAALVARDHNEALIENAIRERPTADEKIRAIIDKIIGDLYQTDPVRAKLEEIGSLLPGLIEGDIV